MHLTKSYEVSWGNGVKSLAVPRDDLAAEMVMTQLPPVPDLPGALLDALENPIGCGPLSETLKPGSTVALITGDRVTDVMLGSRDRVGLSILNHLNRLGVRDDDVTLVYAGGAHGNPDWRERLGPELLARVKAVKHDPRDERNLKFLGVTSAANPVWVNKVVVESDFRLGVGEISPTVHGGWTGGGKIILPGVAGMDTIEQNHHFIMKDVNTVGLADGNHMRVDMEEAARMARLDMKLDVLINRKTEIVGVFAGDFYAEHRAALRAAREIWMTRTDPVDIIVVYPGDGYEQYLSGSIWGRLESSDYALKENGIIIMALSGAGGWADPARVDHDMVGRPEMLKMSSEEIARSMVRKEGNVRNSSILFSGKRVLERRRTFLVCDGIQPQEAREFGFAYCTPSLEDALDKAREERGKDARIAVNIQSKIGWRTMRWREG